ncbi:MAG: hypothetical protein ACRDFB_08820, partial [Rhabdochlamydiaceae bacterium]
MKKEIPPSRRATVSKKKYKTIVIDPPWETHSGITSVTINGRHEVISKKSSKLDYPTMNIDEISRLPIKEMSDYDSHLF